MFVYVLLLVWISKISGFPYKLPCNRAMTSGSVIMGKPAQYSDLINVQVYRNDVLLNSGDIFTSNETLTVQVLKTATISGSLKFMFQASEGAIFQTGNVLCDGIREYNLGDGTFGSTKLRMPIAQNKKVNIWVGWANQYGTVHISSNFTLTNTPTAPDIIPTHGGTNYSYVGCYKDGNPRAMDVQFPGVNYNPESCLHASVGFNYSYFSLQYGGECWASNDYYNVIKYGPSNQCTMDCRHPNPSYPGSCGGSLANALYSTGYNLIVIQLCNVTGNFIGNYITLT